MQVKIHRGINQIGGCVTEIKSKKARILIDVGSNLPNCENKVKVNVGKISKKCDTHRQNGIKIRLNFNQFSLF